MKPDKFGIKVWMLAEALTVEDSYALANNFNEFYTNVGPTAAKKASALASEHGLLFQDNIYI